jgi:hypothetical protein
VGRLDYKTCRVCGRHADQVGELSHSRLCGDCGPVRLRDAVFEQKNHHGPVFQHWRTRIAASVGAVLLDDTRSTP